MIDFYALLGVDKNESSQEIKKAYRKLALKYHPDRHQSDADDAEEMQRLPKAHREPQETMGFVVTVAIVKLVA